VMLWVTTLWSISKPHISCANLREKALRLYCDYVVVVVVVVVVVLKHSYADTSLGLP